jgi:3-hydroxyanthranilate 3,4-dioxygenase
MTAAAARLAFVSWPSHNLPNPQPGTNHMTKMPIVNLPEQARQLGDEGKRVSVLWQEPESLAFVARGREYRSEFHINPSDEVMYQIKGEMKLHYRTPDGKEDIAVIPEGSVIYTPAGTPHSPRFPPDAYALILERKRRDGEIDRFQWYCPSCDALLHEEKAEVKDYREDYVSKAYQRLFDNEEFRTCKQCGEVMPKP